MVSAESPGGIVRGLVCVQFDAPQPGFPSRTQPPNVGLTIGAQSGSVPAELIPGMSQDREPSIRPDLPEALREFRFA